MTVARVAAIAGKEWREIVRDRLYFILAFLLPILLMLVLGYGLTQDVENIPLAVVDEDQSAASRDYARHFTDSRYFHFVGDVPTVAAAEGLIASGRVRVVIVVGDGFARDLRGGRVATVQTLFDGAFIASTRMLQGYVDAIDAEAALDLRTQAVARGLGVTPGRAAAMVSPVQLDVRYLYNQEMRTVWAIAPSLIMNILMWTAPLLVALSVVREKERGSIYNIYASRTSRVEFLLGKLAPCAAISFANAVVLWLLATRWFDAPFKGSLLCLGVATAAYVLATSALGLAVGMLVRTEQAALIVVVLLGAVVGMYFSGMFESVATLPLANRVVSHLFPAMYYNNVVQGTFLKGAGFAASWRDIAATGAFAVGASLAAFALFHKRVRA